MQKNNMLTGSSEELLKVMQSADNQLRGMAGDIPFNYRQATPAEMRERMASLTPDRLQGMIARYGYEKVNNLMRKYGGQYGR